MITIDKEKLIRKLLADGMTISAIAKRAEIGRKLITEIKKLPNIRKRKKPKRTKMLQTLIVLEESKRCETCGGKVFLWPCLLCNPQAGCY